MGLVTLHPQSAYYHDYFGYPRRQYYSSPFAVHHFDSYHPTMYQMTYRPTTRYDIDSAFDLLDLMHAPRPRPRVRVQQGYVFDDLIGVLEHFERPRKRHASSEKSQTLSEPPVPAIDQQDTRTETQTETEAQETVNQRDKQKENQSQHTRTTVQHQSRPIHPFALMIDGVFDALEQLQQSSHQVPLVTLKPQISCHNCCKNCSNSTPMESRETTETSRRVVNESRAESKSTDSSLKESHQEQSGDDNASVHSNESDLSMLERLQTKSNPVLEKDTQDDYVSV